MAGLKQRIAERPEVSSETMPSAKNTIAAVNTVADLIMAHNPQQVVNDMLQQASIEDITEAIAASKATNDETVRIKRLAKHLFSKQLKSLYYLIEALETTLESFEVVFMSHW